MVPPVTPHLVANTGLRALEAAIVDPTRWAIEPKVDGVRGLVVFDGGVVGTRDRRGERREWQRNGAFAAGLRGLAERSRSTCRVHSDSPLGDPNRALGDSLRLVAGMGLGLLSRRPR